MITALLALIAQDAPRTVIEQVYQCEHLAKASAEPHDPIRVDLVLRNRGGSGASAKWIVEWPGKAPISAKPIDVQFGSVGGSAAFEWIDDEGKRQTGFLSFSDIPAGQGKTAAWLGIGKPSLWQAPGYLCAV